MLTYAQPDSCCLGYAKFAVQSRIPQTLEKQSWKAGQKVGQIQVKQHMRPIQTLVIPDQRGYGSPSCCKSYLRQPQSIQPADAAGQTEIMRGLTAVRKKQVGEEPGHFGISATPADLATSSLFS